MIELSTAVTTDHGVDYHAAPDIVYTRVGTVWILTVGTGRNMQSTRVSVPADLDALALREARHLVDVALDHTTDPEQAAVRRRLRGASS